MKRKAYISSSTDKSIVLHCLKAVVFLKLKITGFFCFVVFSVWQSRKGEQIQPQGKDLTGVHVSTNCRK